MTPVLKIGSVAIKLSEIFSDLH